MINAIWGIKSLPFKREAKLLLPQQKQAIEMIHIHAQQGGFSVIIGEPGVGKTVLREHLEQNAQGRDTTVVSCSRTMHTYRQIIWQLAASFLLETKEKNLEADLIEAAFAQVRERKMLFPPLSSNYSGFFSQTLVVTTQPVMTVIWHNQFL